MSFLSNKELLVDIRVAVCIEFSDMGAIGPVLVVDSSPSDFHLINSSPSFECTVLINKPTSNTEIVSFFKVSVLDIVSFSISNFDVVNLGSIRVRNSLSDEIKSVITAFSVEDDLFMMKIVVWGKEFGNPYAVKDYIESVAVLVPKAISGSPIKG